MNSWNRNSVPIVRKGNRNNNWKIARKICAGPILSRLLVFVLFLLATGLGAAPPLVETSWTARNMHRKDVILVDMSQSPTQYERFHLPGAVYLPYYYLVRRLKKKGYPERLPNRLLFGLLGAIGISANAHVVIYDDIGGLEAGRLFWELERIGHRRVSVMNGGLVKWILEGRKVVNTPFRRKPVLYRPSGPGRANEARLKDVRRASTGASGSSLLLDVRTIEEYQGDLKKRRGGHVPGARWWEWDRALDVRRGFVLKKRERLIRSLKKAGLRDTNAPVILYCRSGHRAAQTYWTLRALGFKNVKLYPNSMNEYYRVKAPLRRGSRP